mmetsp:Transcript_26953/g.40271  ORF Transcript_26953/g.40271 Transcript_26953/m.40271 type:complete len:80 (-) Transcript_26953:377-616(-)
MSSLQRSAVGIWVILIQIKSYGLKSLKSFVAARKWLGPYFSTLVLFLRRYIATQKWYLCKQYRSEDEESDDDSFGSFLL